MRVETTEGPAIVADLDDFAKWLYEDSGKQYDYDDEFRVYRVTSDESEVEPFVTRDEESDNPAVRFASFINVNAVQNPLDRDLDELPKDLDEMGEEHTHGETSWVLVTSFSEGVEGTGKVWAVPIDEDDREDGFVLIGGLATPTGVCFDPNHDFLYVCDPGQGAIFQYEVDWDGEERFVLASDIVATIATDVRASDCAVDAYGSLFFVDSSQNSISKIDFLALWSGVANQQTVIYSAENSENSIESPVAIDVFESETLYFVNNHAAAQVGLLNSAPTSQSKGGVRVEVKADRTPWGLAVSPRYAYFSLSDGNVYLYTLHGEPNVFLKSTEFLTAPRGICYGDGEVYVADFSIGEVFSFEDSKEEEAPIRAFVRIGGAYGLECVNG